jgi:hypothetical protein
MAQAPHGDDGTRSGAAVDPPVPPGVDPSAPARLYDYYLGAKPGISFTGQWDAVDPIAADSDGSRVLYCGVARCP